MAKNNKIDFIEMNRILIGIIDFFIASTNALLYIIAITAS